MLKKIVINNKWRSGESFSVRGSALFCLWWGSCCVHAVSPCICPLCPAVSPLDLRQIRLACHEGFPLTGTVPLKCFINPFHFKLFIGNATKHHICQPGSIKDSRRKAFPVVALLQRGAEPLSSSLLKSFIAHYVQSALGCRDDLWWKRRESRRSLNASAAFVWNQPGLVGFSSAGLRRQVLPAGDEWG